MFPRAAIQRLEIPALIVFGALVAFVTVQVAYRFHPLAPLALAGLAAALVLAVWRPIYVVYAAAALVPFELFSFQLGAAGVTPSEGMFALAGVGWAAQQLARGETALVSSEVGKPLALLVLAVVPGLALVPDTFLVLKVFIIWTTFLLVFQMIVTEGDEKTVRNFLFILAVAAAVIGAVAAVRTGGQQPELRGLGETATGRATGSFGHPNTLATFEALALPAALALGLHGRGLIRPIALASFALIFGGLMLSLSRGGLLAVAGALGMMLLWPPFRRTVAVALVIFIAFIAIGGARLGDVQQVQVISNRITSIGYSAGGVDPRFVIWGRTPAIIADHPVFGVGENNFSRVAPIYGAFESSRGTTFEHAHNIPLTFWAELGTLGFGAFVWLVVALTRTLARAYRRAPPDGRGLPLAVAAAFVALALQGLVDYTLRSSVIVAVVFTLAACAVVLARGGDRSAPSPPNGSRGVKGGQQPRSARA